MMEQSTEAPRQLSDLAFEDLYVGPNILRMRLPDGRLEPIPEQLSDEVRSVLDDCVQTRKNRGVSEFSRRVGHMKLRVTAITDDLDQDLFILSRSGGKPWPVEQLGLPEKVIETMVQPGISGLFVVMGPMSSGKTTAASSLMAHRVKELGAYGISIEDPPELDLNGPHGKGWISQTAVSREGGGFGEQTARALRSRADVFLVSEIRDPTTAQEVMRFAPAGRLVMTTLHGDTIEQGLQRLQSLCRSLDPSEQALNGILADALLGVLLLKIHQTAGEGDVAPKKRRVAQALMLNGSDAMAIRSNIRDGKFSSLANYLSMQQERTRWGTR